MRYRIINILALFLIFTGCSLFDGDNSSPDLVSYDLRDLGLISPVKCQCGFTEDGKSDLGSSVGVCWAFSSLASLESSLLKKGIVLSPDCDEASLSPWYLGNYIGYNIPCYEHNPELDPGVEPPTSFGYYYPGSGWGGGGSFWTCDYLIAGNKLPLWCECPMPTEDMSAHNTLIPPLSGNKENYQIKEMIILLAMDFANVEEYRQAVKQYIRENGAIQGMVHIEQIDFESISSHEINGVIYQDHRFMDPRNFDMFTYEAENLATIPLTHAVTFAGWDDHRSIDVDGHLAEGAWLIKDSQSETSWDKGYFWVAYDDLFANLIVSGLVACPPDEYQHQSKYQTHPGGLSQVMPEDNFTDHQILELGSYSYLLNGNANTDSWGVAKFQLENPETLAAVGLFTMNRNQKLSIIIYRDTELGEVLLTRDYTVKEMGYHLLDLGSDIAFAAGESIVIALGFKNDAETMRLPLVYVRDSHYQAIYPTYYGSKTSDGYELIPYPENSTLFLQALMR